MFSGEKSQSHACVCFFSSHIGLQKCRILIFASLYNLQAVVFKAESSLDH